MVSMVSIAQSATIVPLDKHVLSTALATADAEMAALDAHKSADSPAYPSFACSK